MFCLLLMIFRLTFALGLQKGERSFLKERGQMFSNKAKPAVCEQEGAMWAQLCKAGKNLAGILGEKIFGIQWGQKAGIIGVSNESCSPQEWDLCCTKVQWLQLMFPPGRRICSSFSPSQAVQHDAKCWQQIRVHEERKTLLTEHPREAHVFILELSSLK